MRILRAIKKQISKTIDKIRRSIDPVSYARSKGVRVGSNTRLLTADFGSEPYLITIGNHVLISSNVSLLTHDGGSWPFRDLPEYKGVMKYAPVTIEDNCFVGLGAIVMPGVTVHKNSVVGAGSVVTKDVPEGSVVAGVPAKVVCTTMEYAEKLKKNNPPYDLEAFNKDRRKELMRVFNISE